MTTLNRCSTRARQVRDAIGESATVFLKDVGHGLLEVSHNMLALLGLLLVAAAVFTFGKPEFRHAAETTGTGLAAGASPKRGPSRLNCWQPS